MQHQVTLTLPSRQQKTVFSIGEDLLRGNAFIHTCQRLGNRCAIISDEAVGKLYGETLKQELEQSGMDTLLLTFPSGEQSKTRETKATIEDEMLANGHGNDSFVIALGGGVVTDLAGFVAATFCRSIPYIAIPTTLLGMVDASIGGKTGVNVNEGKNLIGAIYAPDAVFIDFSLLETLSDKEIRCGSAEIIKHGLIAKRSLFELIQNNAKDWNSRSLPLLEKAVYQSLVIKRKAIEKGKHARHMLNFGHTVGHAIEKAMNFSLSHGDAVAIGMLAESFLSLSLGYLKEQEFDAIDKLIRTLGFPLKVPDEVNEEVLKEAMAFDKKSKNGAPRFVVLSRIGKVRTYGGEFCTAIDQEMLDAVLGFIVRTVHE